MKRFRQSSRLLVVTRSLPVLALLAHAALAQTPRIGGINFYGLHKLSPDKVLSLLGIKSGAELPRSKGDLEDKLNEIDGIVGGRIEAICCEGPNATLFIGVEERGGPHFDTRPSPAGGATLPEELLAQYRDFIAAVARAAQSGNAGEDLSAGHSLMRDPEARRLQDAFVAYAGENMEVLRDVLRTSSEPEHRAVAATVIGYAPKKALVLNDLQYALQDPDDSVRANAVRSLKAIAVMASRQPQGSVRVAPVWFVEMLNSITLGDRIQASQALVVLTDQPNPSALELIQQRALPALAEMARWKTLDYALPSFLLLGRIAGLTEAQIQDRWQKGDRESVIRKATEPAPPVKR